MEASNLSTLLRRINILLLYTDCRGGRTAAVARHVSFAQITFFGGKGVNQPKNLRKIYLKTQPRT